MVLGRDREWYQRRLRVPQVDIRWQGGKFKDAPLRPGPVEVQDGESPACPHAKSISYVL